MSFVDMGFTPMRKSDYLGSQNDPYQTIVHQDQSFFENNDKNHQDNSNHLLTARKSQTKVSLVIPSSQADLTPKEQLKVQIEKHKNNISGWGDTLENFNPVNNIGGGQLQRKNVIRKLGAKRHITMQPNGSMSPVGGGNNHKFDVQSNGEGSSDRVFNESKAHLDAIMVAESELKAANDRYYKRHINQRRYQNSQSEVKNE